MTRRPNRGHAEGLGVAQILIGVELCGLGVSELIEVYGDRDGADTFDYAYGWALSLIGASQAALALISADASGVLNPERLPIRRRLRRRGRLILVRRQQQRRTRP